MPEALRLSSLKELANSKVFQAANAVFVAPDEIVPELRHSFLQLGIKNDVFGVREAKGLEFPSVAVLNFWSFFESLDSNRPWENCLRWLHSNKTLSTTESNERIQGKNLENCDYSLAHPEIEDQAMMLYTAVTRARAHLYLVEVDNWQTNRGGKEAAKKHKAKNKGVSLADFAFRQLKDLRLIKKVTRVDEGEVGMTAEQHKARGVLLVVQAVTMGQSSANTESVRKKFAEAAERFEPDMGNDRQLLEQCNKHLEVFLMKQSLKAYVKDHFFRDGAYRLCGKFAEVIKYEQDASAFFKACSNDSFLVDEVHEIRLLTEEVFYGTPYAHHFNSICRRVKAMEG